MEKILYIITQSEWGGAGRYVFDLAINLNKSQEYKVHIAAGYNGALFARLEAEKLATTHLKHIVRPINPYHDLIAYFELKKLLCHIKPDIVHLNSSKAGFIGALAAKSCGIKKIIYTAHGFVFNEPLPAWKTWLYKKIELFSSKLIDKIICVSDYDRETGIKAGINPSKLITIHNGIDFNSMNLLPKDAAIHSLPINQSTNKPIIGTIANFYFTKGLDTLIHAMVKIDAILILIGDGPEKKKLSACAKASADKKLNKIIFLGSIENASQYLKAFDLFVLPSRKEGLPYALLEAAGAGVPTVATKVGGVREIIKDNRNGYLAEVDDVDDLANKINFALAHPLSPTLDMDFTFNTMLTKTITVYSV